MGYTVTPPAISSATAAPSPTQINLAWGNGAVYSAVNGIRIRTGPTAGGPTSDTIYLAGSATSYQLTGLTEGGCYWIYIAGKQSYEGFEYWSEWDIYGPVYTWLLAPGSLAASQIIDGKCTLTWQVRSSKALYQQVYKSTDGTNFSQVIGVLDDLVTSKEVTGLTEARYWFRVKCWNDNTSSDWSNVAEAAKALAAPSNLVAAQKSSTSAALTWKDNSSGESLFKIERSTSSSEYSFSQIATVGANVTTFTDTGLTPGTKYYYRVRAYEAVAGNSAYSNVANVTPQAVALPTNVEATALSSTSVKITWQDNSNNETGFKIYQNGTLIYTAGENETSYTKTGLTPATWYKYQIEAFNATDSSGKTAEVKVFTSDPPKAPSGLALLAIGTDKIRANWTDNANNETGFKIERSTDGATYTQVGTVGVNITTFDLSGLSSNTLYYVRVRAYNISGNSAYCTAVTCRTKAAIAVPTEVAATPLLIGGALRVEVRFADNSVEEDKHEIQRSVDGGAYSKLADTIANQYVYYDSAVEAGKTYAYKVRAWQGATSTDLSDAASCTIAAAPSVPSGLTIGDLRWPDRVPLAWTPVPGAVQYVVRISTDGSSYSDYTHRPPAGCDRITVTGLVAKTAYWFKIKSRGVGGYSAESSAVTCTTPEAYVPTKFEALCLQPKKKIVSLVEVNPAIVLSGWALTSGQTYTYETGVSWPEIEIDAVTENGVALVKRTSISSVETSGGWYYDAAAGKIYVRISSGADPVNVVVVASAWVFFTNWQRGSTVYNGRRYLPLVPADGLSEITQTLEAHYRGSVIATCGSVSLINGRARAWGGGHYFDDRCAAWIWRNRKVRQLAGGEGFDYSDFQPIATALISSTSITDYRFSVSLKDAREGLHCNLPKRAYNLTDFPMLDLRFEAEEGATGVPRPRYYGAVTHVIPVCVDTANLIFELHDGRITSVAEVLFRGAALTEGTDYVVDYTMGRIQLAKTLGYSVTEDSLECSFTGQADECGAAIETGPMIFLDMARRDWGLGWADLNLESIWEAHAARPTAQGAKLYKETSTEEFVGLLEKSCLAYSFQDAAGKIGFRVSPAAAPSDTVYLTEQRIVDIGRDEAVDSSFGALKINYDEWPSTQRYRWIEKQAMLEQWTSGVQGTLTLSTTLTDKAGADALADEILDALNLPTIWVVVSRILLARSVGDTVYLTRGRFFDAQGTANNRLYQIVQLSKDPSTGKCRIEIRPVTVTA